MAILNRGVTAGLQGNYVGIDNRVLNLLTYHGPIPYKASTINAVYTKQTFASTVNSSFAAGTAVDFPRNLVYQLSLTNGTASATMISGGTLAIYGLRADGSTISESVAFTSLAAQSVPVQGTAIFAQVNSVSVSNFSLATAASSGSNSVSFSVGVGNAVGVPHYVNGTNPSPVPFAWIGTAIKTTTSATASTSANVFTVVTGSIGRAAVSFSDALATNSGVILANLIWR